MFLLWGLLAYLGLLAALTAATHGAAVGTARLLGLPRFRWFEAGLVAGPLWRRALLRGVSLLAPFALCVGLFWSGLMASGQSTPSTKVVVFEGPAQDAGMHTGD